MAENTLGPVGNTPHFPNLTDDSNGCCDCYGICAVPTVWACRHGTAQSPLTCRAPHSH